MAFDESEATRQLLQLSSSGSVVSNSFVAVVTTTAISSSKYIFTIILQLIRALCQYNIPNSSVILWWSFQIGGFFIKSLILEYMFTMYLSLDIYVATFFSRFESVSSNFQQRSMYSPTMQHDRPCAGDDICYCVEGQHISSFYWTVMLIFLKYCKVVPSKFRTCIFFGSFFVYMQYMYQTDLCTLGGLVFSSIVGAILGFIKIMIYDTVFVPLVRTCLLREENIIKMKNNNYTRERTKHERPRLDDGNMYTNYGDDTDTV
jgi:hypothetical protein